MEPETDPTYHDMLAAHWANKSEIKTSCIYRLKTECPNMKEREGCTSMTYEHYDCKICGAHVALDYDEMR